MEYLVEVLQELHLREEVATVEAPIAVDLLFLLRADLYKALV